MGSSTKEYGVALQIDLNEQFKRHQKSAPFNLDNSS